MALCMEPWGTWERISAQEDMIECLIVHCKRSYLNFLEKFQSQSGSSVISKANS